MPDQNLPIKAFPDLLKEAAETISDSAQGYRTAATDVSDTQLRTIFEKLAGEREQQLQELNDILRKHGAKIVEAGGTTTGAAHRLLLDLKSAITRNDKKAVVDEVVRGESFAEAVFDKVIRADVPAEARQVVDKLHRNVREARDRFRGLQKEFADSNSGGFFDGVVDTGRKSVETVTEYVVEQPLIGTGIALGIGFLLGVLTAVSLRPSRIDIGRFRS